MKICSVQQVREWDQYTIQHEPIASVDLMERAARKCFEWLEVNNQHCKRYCIICGNGNNGGDGLALARMLYENKNEVRVFICNAASKSTADFEANLTRLKKFSVSIEWVTEEKLPAWDTNETIIEALFGSGLSRPPQGISEMLIRHINKSNCTIISIDIPGGLFADVSSKGNTVTRATHTLSFQTYKLAFLLAENEAFFGKVHIIDIGLHPEYINSLDVKCQLIDQSIIRAIYKPRNPFAHKGNFGHALLLAGSYGKMGAAFLSAKACLRSGVGLLTCHIPACGYSVMQTSVPEAMVTTDVNENMLTKAEDNISRYNVIGIGPGIGTEKETNNILREILSSCKKPMLLDADALNIIAANKSLFDLLTPGTVITPHPKEFERLFGKSETDFDRMDKAMQSATQYKLVIVLKGHRTFIALPDGSGYFNSTGNAGMAKGGSGDVLTGIITALLAQGYSSEHAAVMGIYLHGLAGDFAAHKLSQEAMIAGDIVDCLGEAFKTLR